jgi:general secretion pathway protein M
MTQNLTLRRFVAAPIFAADSYLGVMLLLLFAIGSSLADVLSQRAEVSNLHAMLEHLEGRKPARQPGQLEDVAGLGGSPFLEGATITVAGAALLQRVTAAVTKLGGNVLSSQVDLQGMQAKSGFLSIVASRDIDQLGLQQLLYDLEAGQPFLFVEQLFVQAPASLGSSGAGKLRVLLSVSGQWQGAKS